LTRSAPSKPFPIGSSADCHTHATGAAWLSITRRINARNRLWDHLFGGRYKANLIEGNLSGIGHRLRWQRDYLTEGLKHFHIDDISLRRTPKGDWRKVAIAWAICERTTARQDWIADRLHLKSASKAVSRKGCKDQTEEGTVMGKAMDKILNSRTDPRFRVASDRELCF
jgi:hypothetical protein